MLTDYWPIADALTTCRAMARALRKMSAEDAAVGVCWLWGRIVYLEREVADLRREIERVKADAASRIAAAQIDEAEYQRLLDRSRQLPP